MDYELLLSVTVLIRGRLVLCFVGTCRVCGAGCACECFTGRCGRRIGGIVSILVFIFFFDFVVVLVFVLVIFFAVDVRVSGCAGGSTSCGVTSRNGGCTALVTTL